MTARGNVVMAIALCAALAVSACSTYEPGSRTVVDDVPPGPGLFTGDDGAFYIFRGAPSHKDGQRER